MYSGVIGRCAIKWSTKLREDLEEKWGEKISEGSLTTAEI
jgi:hypothetical protein